jgi:hypothetical protein
MKLDAEQMYRHATILVDGVSVDILLDEEEIKTTSKRALKYSDYIPNQNQCWPIGCKNTKCSLLKWIMGRCCECGDCEE